MDSFFTDEARPDRLMSTRCTIIYISILDYCSTTSSLLRFDLFVLIQVRGYQTQSNSISRGRHTKIWFIKKADPIKRYEKSPKIKSTSTGDIGAQSVCMSTNDPDKRYSTP
jgi:hypothetical protein